MPRGRSRHGVTFCGYRVRREGLFLTRRRKRRYRSARRAWELAYDLGLIDAAALQRGVGAAVAITAHARSTGFRRRDLAGRPSLDA